MSEKKWLATATLVGLFALTSPAGADDKKFEVEDLPKAVLKTVKAKFSKAKIRGVSKEAEGGETKYEVEMTIGGKSVDVIFEADGEIAVIEKEIEPEDLPRAVLRTMRAKFPRARVEKIEEVTEEDNKVLYEVVFVLKGKQTVEVLMAPNGKIIEKSEAEEGEDKDDEKGEKKARKSEKDDDDEKGEKKARKSEKDDDDEKGEKKARKSEKDDDDEKGEKKARKSEKDDDDEKGEKKARKSEKDDDDDDDDDKSRA